MIIHVYLKLYPSRVFVYLKYVCTKSTSDIATKGEKTLIGRTIEKPGHCMPFQFGHRLCNHLPLVIVDATAALALYILGQ